MINSSRLYGILAGAVIIAVILLGWFGAISPQLQQITLDQDQITSVNAQNDVLTQTLSTLKSESDRLPELHDELDALRLQVPESPEVDSFVRELQLIAAANGIDLTGLTVSEAALYPAATAVAAAPTAAPSATATPAPVPTNLTTPVTTTPTTSSSDVQPSPALAPNLYTINLIMTVSGPGDGIIAFVNALQKGTRIFLVTSVNLSTQAADALGTATISGYMFIVSTPATRAAAATAASTAAPTPTPTPTATPTPTPTPSDSPTPTPTPSPTETPAG